MGFYQNNRVFPLGKGLICVIFKNCLCDVIGFDAIGFDGFFLFIFHFCDQMEFNRSTAFLVGFTNFHVILLMITTFQTLDVHQIREELIVEVDDTFLGAKVIAEIEGQILGVLRLHQTTHELRTCVAEAINGLLDIPNTEDVVSTTDGKDEFILDFIGILELVHENILYLWSKLICHIEFGILQNAKRHLFHVREIQDLSFFFDRLVMLTKLDHQIKEQG